MEHTEKKEAPATIDVIAAEIHGEYMKVAEQQGHKLAPWNEIPEEAKGMCRSLARLTLDKMKKVYEAGESSIKALEEKVATLEKKPAAPAGTPPQKARSPEEIQAFMDAAVVKLRETMDHWGKVQAGNPLEKGIDAALQKFSEALAIEVLQKSPELMDQLKQNVAEALTSGLMDDKEE